MVRFTGSSMYKGIYLYSKNEAVKQLLLLRNSTLGAVSGVPLWDDDGKLLVHLFLYENTSTQPKFTRLETVKL